MSLTIGDVRRWSFGGVDSAATAALGHRGTLVGLQDELDASARPAQWQGGGATAAETRHGEISEALRRTAAQAAAVARALDQAGATVTTLQQMLGEADTLASQHGFSLGDDGVVRDVSSPEMCLTEAAEADRVRIRDELVTRLERVLATATDMDADLAKVLLAAAHDEIDDGDGTSLYGAGATGSDSGRLRALPPPEDGSPAENASWWDSLTPAQQQDYLSNHPDVVGNMDGVPAEVRDEANRARLADERAALEAEAERLQQNLDDNVFGGAFTFDDGRLDVVNNKLKDLDAIEATLEGDDKQLLLLDSSGDMVKTAIATGNVDTADHVSVFTSGLDSNTRDSLEGYDKDQSALRQETLSQLRLDGRSDETVATVTWMGYEAPSMGGFLDDFDNDDMVTNDGAAQKGADNLSSFLNGIDASRPTDPNLTALGHSYGSLTTGLALQQGTGVDNAVLYGSPGLGTSHVEDLKVPEGHVFVAEAKNDPVADFAAFGYDPNQMDGVNTLSTDSGYTPDGEERSGSEGHSEYVKDGTMAQYNMAAVIAGNRADIVDGEHFGAGDVVNWNPFL
ncbi:alpha/beta hydrolase [Rhodococcus sp. X156]|uniref:alpha/beta hydrolase n=1 Tax=Rhodococcus sp. X156 TaxID=2499145 RepID=UPI000FD8DF82|nr:alpha/beta hydrolase [Rhodococcus sp. X156]